MKNENTYRKKKKKPQILSQLIQLFLQLVPGSLWIPKPTDTQVLYIKCRQTVNPWNLWVRPSTDSSNCDRICRWGTCLYWGSTVLLASFSHHFSHSCSHKVTTLDLRDQLWPLRTTWMDEQSLLQFGEQRETSSPPPHIQFASEYLGLWAHSSL